LDQEFLWPGKEESLKLQLASGEQFQHYDEEGLGLTETGKWLVPLKGMEDFRKEFASWLMPERPAGHGGIQTTLEAIRKVFWWPKMEEEVQVFVKTCLQCLCARGGRIEPRPCGGQIHSRSREKCSTWIF
jgi:hypothetical protein